MSKVDEKKQKKKPNIQSNFKSIDVNDYLRLSNSQWNENMSEYSYDIQYDINNIELLFQDFENISNENWNESPDHYLSITYPSKLNIIKEISINELLNIEINSKTNKSNKKAVIEITDKDFDELNRKLPHIFVDSEKYNHQSFNWNQTYSCNSNNEQINNIICEVYNIISNYAPIIINYNKSININNGFEYLWKLIYPKNSNGKPCYNPSGKYVVKLFLCGKWRKVYINDSIPIQSDGSIGIASSSDKYELWQTLLAKAIYCVFSNCGYNLLVCSNENQNTSSFIGFAIHLLTSWMPSLTTPISIFQSDRNITENVINEMLNDNIQYIDQIDLPTKLDSIIDIEGNSKILVDGDIISDEDDSIDFQTKRLFQIKYNKQKIIYLSTCYQLIKRELQLLRLKQLISQIYKQVYIINYYDNEKQTDIIYDIKAISLSKSLSSYQSEKSKINYQSNDLINYINTFDYDELCNIQLLVNFSDASNENYISSYLSDYLKSLQSNDTSIHLSHLESNNLSTDLNKSLTDYLNNYIADYQLNNQNSIKFPIIPQTTNFSTKWVSISSLLSVNAQFISLATNVSTNGTINYSAKHNYKIYPILTGSSTSNIKDKKASVDNTIVNKTINQLNHNNNIYLSINPINITGDFIKLTIFIHADIVNSTNNSTSISTKLIVQEIRLDEIEPLVFHCEIPSNSYLPIYTKTFNILKNKFKSNEKLVFSIQLLTISSIHLSMYSDQPILLDNNEKIWSNSIVHNSIENQSVDLLYRNVTELSSYGRYIYHADGKTNSNSFNNQERLLFRYTLSIKPNQLDNQLINCSLYIKEIFIQSFAYLTIYLPDGNSYDLPKLINNCISLPIASDNIEITLIGKIHPKLNSNVYINSFNWSLTILSVSPINNKNSVEFNQNIINYISNNSIVRYENRYVNNNKYILFKDVYTFDSSISPIALRIGIKQPISYDNDSDINVNQDVPLVLTIYRKYDRKLMYTFKSKSVIQVYNLDISNCIDTSNERPNSPISPSNDKSKQSNNDRFASPNRSKTITPKTKFKKNEKIDVSFDIIIECYIDNRNNYLSHELSKFLYLNYYSKQPYSFSNQLDNQLDNQLNNSFNWYVDVLIGKVTQASHDLYDINRYLDIKNSWEINSEGRFEQASSALESYKNRKLMKSSVTDKRKEEVKDKFVEKSVDKQQDKEKPIENRVDKEKSTDKLISPKNKNNILNKINSNSNITLDKSYYLDKFIDNLSSSLKIDKENIRQRYEASKTLAESKPVIFIDDTNIKSFVSEDEINNHQINYKKQMDILISNSLSILNHHNQSNFELSNTLSNNINNLLYINSYNMKELSNHWNKRENYRLDVQNKQITLSQLISKGNEAIKYLQDKENENINNENKKSKKK